MHDLRSEKERSLSDEMEYVSAGDLVVASGRLKIMHSHGILRGSKAAIRALDYDASTGSQLNQDSQRIVALESHQSLKKR